MRACLRLLFLLLAFSAAGCASSGNPSPVASPAHPRYLFLFIGDGMGVAQVSLAGSLTSGDGTDGMASMPVTGLVDTRAADRRITDSAAAGTALASGRKTDVGVIGMGPGCRDTLMSITDACIEAGMKVGIVTTVSIDHATPAAFYAHAASRRDVGDIARQMASSGVDYFAGGAAAGAMSDTSGHLQAMRSHGYRIADGLAALQAVPKGSRCWARMPHDRTMAMPFAIDRGPDAPTLAELTREGIRLLEGPDGFFMMVEGGRIDWACHANDAAAMVRDVQDFDRAVAVALDFARRHPRETLVVVTADHECGGLSLGTGARAYQSDFSLLASRAISMQALAWKVEGWRKTGRVNAAMALDSLRLFCGSEAFAEGGAPALRKAYANAMAHGAKGAYLDPFTLEVNRQLNLQAGIGWASTAHTAVAVPVFAEGQGAEAFLGSCDNTDIPKKMLRAAGVPHAGITRELLAEGGRCQVETEQGVPSPQGDVAR